MAVAHVLLCSVFLISLSCFLLTADAQGCKSGCSAGLTTCSNIDYQLYFTNSSDIVASELNANLTITQIKANATIPQQCKDFLSIFVCNIFHPSCNGTNNSSAPLLPCVDMCNKLQALCQPYFSGLPASIQAWTNCSGVDSANNTLYATIGATCSNLTNAVSLCPPVPVVFKNSGTCQIYNRTLNPNTFMDCQAFVNPTVFMKAPQNLIDASLKGSLATAKASYPMLSVLCWQYLMSYVCNNAYGACVNVHVDEFNISAFTSAKKCNSFCHGYYDSCLDFYNAANVTHYLPNCSDYNTYPISSYVAVVGNGHAQMQCNNRLFPTDPYAQFELQPVATCPPGTGPKIIRNVLDAHCGLACPDTSYNTDEWHELVVTTQVGASLSLICMIFLIASYLISYEKRKFPSAFHICEFVATALFAISFLIGGSQPEKDVWCADPGTNATQFNNSTCAIQGFFFILFGIALASWCCIIAFIMFFAIVLGRKVNDLRPYAKVFLIVGWTLPLAFAIGALASGSIGYGPPLAWCFIQFSGHGYTSQDAISRDYIFFYIPILLMFVSIFVMFTATVAKIIYVRRHKITNSSVGRHQSRTFQAQVRILIFIFVVFAICFTIFEWRFQIEAINQRDNLLAVGLAWTYCKIKKAAFYPNPGVCDGDTNPARIDYAHTSFESFLLSGLGLLIFIGFGADMGIYRHWAKVGKIVLKREWGTLHDFIFTGKDPFSSSSTRTPGSKTTPSSVGSGGHSNSDHKIEKSVSMRAQEPRSGESNTGESSDSAAVAVADEKPGKTGKIDVFVL